MMWYIPLVRALRAHIERKHLEQDGAMDELRFTEEFLAYSEWSDDEIVRIGCPWSEHCHCDWEVKGRIHIDFEVIG
jgi:hypothetical protein|tara:strand:+ start:115 stop:342 length:228 start_codon:yes stop_codon:yes gene_type:complete